MDLLKQTKVSAIAPKQAEIIKIDKHDTVLHALKTLISGTFLFFYYKLM